MSSETSSYLQEIAASFKPAWWCPGAHAQTIFRFLCAYQSGLPLHRIRIEIPDGDFLDLDMFEGDPDKPRVLVLHGLEGSSNAYYVQGLVGYLGRRRWNLALMNFRACSGEMNRKKHTYHSGKTEDIGYVADYLYQDLGWRNFHVVGYSIGGNMVVKWLGEKGASARGMIAKGFGIGVPYDLAQSVERMEQGFNLYVYTRRLVKKLKKRAYEKIQQFPGLIRWATLQSVLTFTHFDRHVTAPLNDFKDERDYWDRSSAKHFLDPISVPTYLIHAKDDPFFPVEYLPDNIGKNPNLRLILTKSGGHLGFVSGPWPWKQQHWLEQTVMQLMELKEA